MVFLAYASRSDQTGCTHVDSHRQVRECKTTQGRVKTRKRESEGTYKDLAGCKGNQAHLCHANQEERPQDWALLECLQPPERCLLHNITFIIKLWKQVKDSRRGKIQNCMSGMLAWEAEKAGNLFRRETIPSLVTPVKHVTMFKSCLGTVHFKYSFVCIYTPPYIYTHIYMRNILLALP